MYKDMKLQNKKHNNVCMKLESMLECVLPSSADDKIEMKLLLAGWVRLKTLKI